MLLEHEIAHNRNVKRFLVSAIGVQKVSVKKSQ